MAARTGPTPIETPFRALERNARNNPSGVFVETVDAKVLNSEALIHVRKLAFELRHLGVKPGDVVAVDAPDSLFVLFLLAIFHEACVSTILPQGFEPNEAFSVDWMFTTREQPASHATRTVSVDGAFLRQVDQNPYGIVPREYESPGSRVRISFSSGTTGRPNAMSSSYATFAAYAVDALETWMEGDPFLMLFKASTPAGLNAFCLSVLDGRPYLSVGNAEIGPIVELAARRAVTSIKASPAQLAELVDVLERQNRTLPEVCTVYVTGTVMPTALAARLRRVTDGCEIFALYGSSEATMATARYYDSDDPFDVGHVFGHSEIEIVDDDDSVLPAGEVGRLRHRHPLMVDGYLGNPEGTRAHFRDGWFYPGDLGVIRPDGGLTLAGRSSELLNAGGVKIDPVRLDLFARDLEGVIDAASFAYTSAVGTDAIGIALVTALKFDASHFAEAIRVKFGSASPKLIARVEKIPRNEMGKPLRRELADRFSGS